MNVARPMQPGEISWTLEFAVDTERHCHCRYRDTSLCLNVTSHSASTDTRDAADKGRVDRMNGLRSLQQGGTCVRRPRRFIAVVKDTTAQYMRGFLLQDICSEGVGAVAAGGQLAFTRDGRVLHP
jgi:hypothetical protein